RRTRRREPLGDRFQTLDLETDVVDAAPALAALHAGHGVVLEVEDGEIDVAVAQVVALRSRAVDPGDLLHPEHVDVELRRLVDILGRERDVLDLGHGRDASCSEWCLAGNGQGTPEPPRNPGICWAALASRALHVQAGTVRIE